MIRQSLPPRDAPRLEGLTKLVKILGILQKAERDPQDCIFGNSCKRQKMIPKDVLEESVVKPYSQGVLDEDINLGVTKV